MENIAIIPARGGSKRIPRKNIRPFLGKPVIAYSIAAALQSGLFDEVMVSTDDEEIAEVARQYGAKVPFMRSATTADDYATTADVMLEVLECYKKQGIEFDTLCCVYSFRYSRQSEKCVSFAGGEKVRCGFYGRGLFLSGAEGIENGCR